VRRDGHLARLAAEGQRYALAGRKLRAPALVDHGRVVRRRRLVVRVGQHLIGDGVHVDQVCLCRLGGLVAGERVHGHIVRKLVGAALQRCGGGHLGLWDRGVVYRGIVGLLEAFALSAQKSRRSASVVEAGR
jgi:hypothetical protein